MSGIVSSHVISSHCPWHTGDCGISWSKYSAQKRICAAESKK